MLTHLSYYACTFLGTFLLLGTQLSPSLTRKPCMAAAVTWASEVNAAVEFASGASWGGFEVGVHCARLQLSCCTLPVKTLLSYDSYEPLQEWGGHVHLWREGGPDTSDLLVTRNRVNHCAKSPSCHKWLCAPRQRWCKLNEPEKSFIADSGGN